MDTIQLLSLPNSRVEPAVTKCGPKQSIRCAVILRCY